MSDTTTNPASYLYEVPGPRGRRRIILGSIISALVIAGIIFAGLWQFGSRGQLDADKWTPCLLYTSPSPRD